ncbi:MAG: colanic acid biosynthesis acetyltransferase WcaF [Phycisphaeraceae bacterium]|nr:colanic acid biosynthesis acetyltransferase WcaF [Phycisphaeraceae bacterium]
MIDVMIITYNEALNLPYCLRALTGWVRKIYVVDSGSTDGTVEIARSFGAEVVPHAWEGYAQQKNWGLRNLPLEADWILILDADEVITEPLQRILAGIGRRPADQVPENGFFINRLTYFLDKPIRHCGYYPSWNLRLFKRGKGLYENREVHEHVIVDHPVGYIREPMVHHDRRGLEHYVAKHNRYSTLEARSILRYLERQDVEVQAANIPEDTRRRRWLKRHVTPYLPLPGLSRFIYMYFFRLGCIDGRVGYQFSKFISWYDSLVALKLRELRRQVKSERKKSAPLPIQPAVRTSGLAIPEGADPVVLRSPALRPPPGPELPIHMQMKPEPSPWSFKEKLARAVWMVVARPIFRLSFHNWHRLRTGILRLFGAKIGKGVAIRPTVNVEVPWMLDIEDEATIGDYAILYSLGKIHIGKRAIISQYAHICAGTHDYTDHRFPLIRSPINIGDDVWIGADVFVGPGVDVGSLTVIGARSSVYKSLPPGKVCVGNPAKPIKDRLLQ